MTEAETASAEGFAALKTVHARTWSFGVASFDAVASTLQPDDPRMAGSADRLIEVLVSTSDLPTPEPKRGDELHDGARYHRVVRSDSNPITGITIMLVIA